MAHRRDLDFKISGVALIPLSARPFIKTRFSRRSGASKEEVAKKNKAAAQSLRVVQISNNVARRDHVLSGLGLFGSQGVIRLKLKRDL